MRLNEIEKFIVSLFDSRDNEHFYEERRKNSTDLFPYRLALIKKKEQGSYVIIFNNTGTVTKANNVVTDTNIAAYSFSIS